MQNTKLILLLKTFSQSEFRDFKDFVHSPIFNKNKKIIAIFDILKEFYPDFDNSNLDEEKIYMKIFKEEKYDYHKIKNIISDLLALAKDYLSFQYFRDSSKVKEKYLLYELRNRNLDSMFLQSYKTYTKNLEDSGVRDENYLLHKYELIEEIHSYYSPKEPNTHFNYFQEELDLFLQYSLIILLKFYNIMLHERKQNNISYDMKMFEEVFEYLKNIKTEDNPTLLIYYNIVLLEKERDQKYFFELKKLKDKYFDKLNKKDQYMLFLHMSGFCAYVFNVLGRTDFMKEHFLLSKENYDRGTILLGKILYLDFLNHVKIAVRVNEFEWAEKYMDKFRNNLTEEKESTLNFCYGYINYKQGNLDKAMDLLSKANFPNFIIKIQVKILLLQVYYEKAFYDQALAMIDTFRHYLTREKSIVVDFKESFFDYLKITSDLVKIKTSLSSSVNGYNFRKLKDDVEKIEYNQFGIKNWLRTIVKELK